MRALSVCLMLLTAAVVAGPGAAGTMDPVLASSVGDGMSNDVVLVGDLAYCASGGGLTIWDISGSTPRYVGGCDTSGFAVSVAVHGWRAYVGTTSVFFMSGDTSGGLEVVDISDPTHPTVLGICRVPPMYPGRMVVLDSGNHVCILQAGMGLWVFDVSNPRLPLQAATYSETCACFLDIATSGDCAYVAADYGLVVMDLSDPTAPTWVGTCQGVPDAYSVDITGQYAVVAGITGNILSALDISDPASPALVGAYWGGGSTGWSWVGAAGDVAYVLEGQSVLLAISIADPTQPSLVGSLPVPSDPAMLRASPNRVCLMPVSFNWAWDSVMTLVDVSDPSSPVLMASTPATGVPSAIAAKEGYAVVLDGGKLNVVSVCQPHAPELLGSCEMGWGLATLKLAGDYAYIATGGGGLRIVDISDPASPVDVPGTWFGDCVCDVAVAGAYAYALVPNVGSIVVVHASGPQVGQMAGGCPYYYGKAIGSDGTYLYVLAFAGGLDVYDISDPLHPTPLGHCDTTAWEPHTVVVSDDYAYISAYTDGLAIVDISDPLAPFQAAAVPAVKAVWDVAINGEHAYLADDEAGVRVVDVSVPEAPVDVGSCHPWGAAFGVASFGKYIYVADYGWGLGVWHTAPLFADVSADYWAYRQIAACYAADIAFGYWDETYRPAKQIARDEMAVYVSRALARGDANVPAGPPQPSFPDVPASHWAYRYIEHCRSQQVVEGYWDGYHPEEIVNRAQMAVFVARALVAPSGDAAIPDPEPPATFPDVATDHWAWKWVEYCHAQGVVQGYWDGYHPEEIINRAQMAVYVARAFDLAI
jgi:hypothetical protein